MPHLTGVRGKVFNHVNKFPTLREIQSAIPQSCFEPSVAKSMYYVVRDLLIIGGLFLLAFNGIPLLAQPWSGLAWVAYWFLQGTMFWALFVLAHDCGHGSFSRNKTLNSFVGNVLNSIILVPYTPWALSHRHHHQNTGHIDNDEPFTPERSSSKPWKIKKDAFRHSFRRALVGCFGLMWFPYLFYFSRALKSHFWPFDPLFQSKKSEVVTSIVCWILAFSAVVGAVVLFGFQAVAFYYLIPIFVFASWLVVTTFLHHNDENTPWYGDGKWNYVKGNLSSVDRSYGIFNNLVHDIGTHQVHHLFPFIPHYNLRKATLHFREKFPHLARVSSEPIIASYFKNISIYVKHGHTVAGVDYFLYEDVINKKKQAQQADKTYKTV